MLLQWVHLKHGEECRSSRWFQLSMSTEFALLPMQQDIRPNAFVLVHANNVEPVVCRVLGPLLVGLCCNLCTLDTASPSHSTHNNHRVTPLTITTATIIQWWLQWWLPWSRQGQLYWSACWWCDVRPHQESKANDTFPRERFKGPLVLLSHITTEALIVKFIPCGGRLSSSKEGSIRCQMEALGHASWTRCQNSLGDARMVGRSQNLDLSSLLSCCSAIRWWGSAEMFTTCWQGGLICGKLESCLSYSGRPSDVTSSYLPVWLQWLRKSWRGHSTIWWLKAGYVQLWDCWQNVVLEDFSTDRQKPMVKLVHWEILFKRSLKRSTLYNDHQIPALSCRLSYCHIWST